MPTSIAAVQAYNTCPVAYKSLQVNEGGTYIIYISVKYKDAGGGVQGIYCLRYGHYRGYKAGFSVVAETVDKDAKAICNEDNNGHKQTSVI